MRKLSLAYIFLLSSIISFGQWELVDTSYQSHYNDMEIVSNDRILFMGTIDSESAVLIYNPILQDFDTTFLGIGQQIIHSYLLNDSSIIALTFSIPDQIDVHKSENQGDSFFQIGSFQQINGNSCYGFHFMNDTIGFFSGTQTMKTIDGGYSWSEIYESSFTDSSFGGCPIDSYSGSVFMILGNGFYESNDYGINWGTTSSNLSNRWFRAIDFNEFNGDLVFGGMGSHGTPNFNYGVIAKTSDFGNTWAYTDIIEAYQIMDVEMVSSTVGYAVGPYTTGGSHSLYKTYDGGSTWHPQVIDDALDFNTGSTILKCLSEDTCFTCGAYGEILQTFNGGISIHEYDIAPLLAVYPNPVTDLLNLAGIPKGLKANYNIYSIDGRIIQTGRLAKTVSVADLITGTYLIRVFSEQGERTLKFVKE